MAKDSVPITAATDLMVAKTVRSGVADGAWLFWVTRKDGLPDPKGSLSLFLPSSALIKAANHEVMEATREDNKRGVVQRYKYIGRYASGNI